MKMNTYRALTEPNNFQSYLPPSYQNLITKTIPLQDEMLFMFYGRELQINAEFEHTKLMNVKVELQTDVLPFMYIILCTRQPLPPHYGNHTNYLHKKKYLCGYAYPYNNLPIL